MNALHLAALAFQRFAVQGGWPFVFIGGLAVGAWGEPRTTRDFDVCLFTDFGGEEAAIAEVLRHFEPRDADAAAFALRHRVLKILGDAGVPGDISLGALPFERETITRSSLRRLAEGVALRVPAPEDLIVMKAFAGRSRDWDDIAGILRRQASTLDLRAIIERAAPLFELLERPEGMARLRGMIERPTAPDL